MLLKGGALPIKGRALHHHCNHCLHLLVLELVVRALTHAGFDLKSTLVSAKVMPRCFLTKEKLRKDLKLITLEDHQWHSRSLDHNFVGVV